MPENPKSQGNVFFVTVKYPFHPKQTIEEIKKTLGTAISQVCETRRSMVFKSALDEKEMKERLQVFSNIEVYDTKEELKRDKARQIERLAAQKKSSPNLNSFHVGVPLNSGSKLDVVGIARLLGKDITPPFMASRETFLFDSTTLNKEQVKERLQPILQKNPAIYVQTEEENIAHGTPIAPFAAARRSSRTATPSKTGRKSDRSH